MKEQGAEVVYPIAFRDGTVYAVIYDNSDSRLYDVTWVVSLLLGCAVLALTLLVLGGITVASEWRRIHAPAWKKIAFTLTFPLFMLTYLPISLAALFMKVEWKPIHHSVNLTSLPSPAVKN